MADRSRLVARLEAQEKARKEQYNRAMQDLERQRKETMKKYEKQLQKIEARKDNATEQYERDLEDLDQKKTDVCRAAATNEQNSLNISNTASGVEAAREDSTRPEISSRHVRDIPEEASRSKRPAGHGHPIKPVDPAEPHSSRPSERAHSKPTDRPMARRGTIKHETDARPENTRVPERRMSRRGTLPHRADPLSGSREAAERNAPRGTVHIRSPRRVDDDTVEISNTFSVGADPFTTGHVTTHISTNRPLMSQTRYSQSHRKLNY